MCLRKSDWCNFWELARTSRSGTHIEALHVSRERLSLSQQVSGFIRRTCIWYVCLLYASAWWKLCLSCHIAWRVVIAWHDIIGILILCMGLGCRPDSVAVIPQGQWWNNVRIILPDVSRFFLRFRVGLVGQGSYTRADNGSCYLHHAFIYILSMDPH